MKFKDCQSPLKFAVNNDEFNKIICQVTREVRAAKKQGLTSKLNVDPEIITRANELFRTQVHPQAESHFYNMVNLMTEKIAGYSIEKFDVMVQGYCKTHKGIHTRRDTVTDLAALKDPTKNFWEDYNVICNQCADTGARVSPLEKRIMTLRVDFPRSARNNDHKFVAIQGGLKFIAFKLADKMVFDPDFEEMGQYELDKFSKLASIDTSTDEGQVLAFKIFNGALFDYKRYTTIVANGQNNAEDVKNCKNLLKRIRKMGQLSSIIFKDKLTGMNPDSYRDLKDIILYKKTGELSEGKVMTLKMAELAERHDSYKHGVYKKLQVDQRGRYQPLYNKVAKITLAITELAGRSADTVYKYQAPGRLHHY